jgi:nucleoid-associated protein YejK
MRYDRYEIYELLKSLMEAMIREDEDRVEKLEKELEAYITNAEVFNGKDFAYELFELMRKWAEELRKSRRFKNALLDFIDDAFADVYDTIESRTSNLREDMDKLERWVYRMCDD